MKLYKHRQSISLFLAFVLCLSLSPRQALAASTGEGDAAAAVELPLPGEQAAPAAAAPAQDELGHEPAAAGQPGEPDGDKEPAGNVEDENGSEKLNENEDETIVYACAEGTNFALLCVGGKGLIYDAQAQKAVARAAEGLSLSEGTELKHCTVGPEGALSAVLGESLLIVGRVFTAQELPAAQAELEAYLAAGVQGEPTGEPPVEQPGQGEAPAGQPDEGEPAGEPTPMPAVDFPVQTVDGMTVTVSAPEGAFPAGVTMSVSAVEDEEILTAMAEAAAVGLGAVQAVDIVFLSAEGEELQPALPIRVSIVSAAIVGADGAAVVHVDGEGQAAVVSQLDEESAEDEVLFEAEAFSPYGVAAIYSVDFYYIDENTGRMEEYHVIGGGSVLLSELLDALRIERAAADVTELSFTDESLIALSREAGDWRLTSLRPFHTAEALSLSFSDGTCLEITVMDAVGFSGLGSDGAGWQLEDLSGGNYRLVLRANQGHGGSQAGGGSASINRNYRGISADDVNRLFTQWPWLASQYRTKITEVEIRSEITIGQDVCISGMFEGLTNLKSIKYTNNGALDTSKANNLSYMFRDCPNLTSNLPSNPTTDPTTDAGINTANFIKGLQTDNAGAFQRMFSGCSSLSELDLSGWTNDGKAYNMQNMFNGCTNLHKVVFNNAGFETRKEPDGARLGGGLSGMFTGCDQLQYVDMSNLKIHLQPSDTSLKAQFTGKSKLQTLLMKNTVIDGVQDLRGAFSNCPNLTNVQMTGDGVFPDAVTMENLFASSFTNPQDDAKVDGKVLLDVSGFGVLEDIVKMDGFVSGCTRLQTLNIDNLDNSRIKPANRNHPASDTDPGAAAVNTDWGRMLGVETCTALETLSAQNSKVWMVARNSRGNPGEEYYDASNASAIYYFTDKQMEFKADVGPTTVTIDSDRDWIDLITDRDGTNMPTLNAGSFPDSVTNINWSNEDLNPNGAGFLAPGVYTLKSESRSDPGGTSFPDTYYRVAYIGEVPYEVYVNNTLVEDRTATEDGLVVVQTGNNTWVSTTARNDWLSSGSEKTIDTEIKFVYKDAAIDVNGKKHNVAITVNSITFKDLDLVPTDPGRTDDPNNYYDTDGGGTYYRSVLQATRDEGVIFRNGLYISDPASPWERSAVKALSGGSGMDVSFKVEIERALPDTHFVFYVDDLDVEKSQSWIQETDDWCDDKLPVGNKTYGTGGESFELGSGNGSANFAPHTGLVQVGNTVITTGSDPSTSWSEFTVEAEATGANYTWKSGVSCSTQAMKNTPKLYLGEVELDMQALKTLVGGTLEDDDFEFTLEYVGVDPSDAPAPTGISFPVTVGNAADGTISFGTLAFANSDSNSVIYQEGTGDKYFPGTDPSITTTAPDGNSGGKAEHNTFTYTFKAYEVIPSLPGDFIYDPHDSTNNAYKIEVVISTPEDETEMAKGVKIEIKVDDVLTETLWSGTAPEPIGTPFSASPVSSTAANLPFVNKVPVVDLAICKQVAGNQASKDKFFKFDVTISKVPAGTVLELDTSKLVKAPSQNVATSYGAGDMAKDNGHDDMPSLTYGSATPEQRVNNVWTYEGYTYVYDGGGGYDKYDSNGNSVGSVSEPDGDATCGIPGQQLVADSNDEVKLTVYLQHGNELILKGIPYGAAYYVVEDAEDYLPELMLGPIDKSDPPKTYDDKTDEVAGGGSSSGTPISEGLNINEAGDTFFQEDTKLTFTNTRDGVVPTGMDTEMRGPMLLAMTGALALLTLGYLGRRRRRHGPA